MELLESRMKVALLIVTVFVFVSSAPGAAKDFALQGKTLVFQNPSFSFTLPSDLQWVHSSISEHPNESSSTRTFFFIKQKNRQIEELLIVQIADKTNPHAGPMVLPMLKPYAEKKMYLKGKLKKGEVEIDDLTQAIAWNPEAPSLQPVLQKGMILPAHLALQYQFLFQPVRDHAVFVRYSKDVHSFGVQVSAGGKDWDREALSGKEKSVYETFQKTVSGMIDSLHFQSP